MSSGTQRRILKWVGRTVGSLIVLAILLGAVGYAVLKNTVPAPSGSLAIAGLSTQVEVVRDREGVPHIFARTVEDGICALGFVHAQDRLWQMELLRRAGQGRLSEIFGEETINTDIFMRTLDFHGLSDSALARLSPRTRAFLEAYARGVNAYLERETRLFEP